MNIGFQYQIAKESTTVRYIRSSPMLANSSPNLFTPTSSYVNNLTQSALNITSFQPIKLNEALLNQP